MLEIKNTKYMNIAFGIDDKFVMPCGVTMTSICENNKEEDICFHVLTPPEFSDRGVCSLTNIAQKYGKQIKFYPVEIDKLKDCPINVGADNGCLATYFRFLLPVILSDIDKVIYMDSDLVVRHSLSEFWNTNLDGYAVGVCPGENNDDIRESNRLRYDVSVGYFNAGVLIVNLKYWRKHNVFRRLIDYGANSPKLLQQDQDCLNAVLKDEKKVLNIKYNLQENMLVPIENVLLDWHRFEELEAAIKDPVIIHYTSSLKPWYSDCNHPYKREWRKYCAMTEWRNMKLKSRYPNARYVQIARAILARMKMCQPAKNKFREGLHL